MEPQQTIVRPSKSIDTRQRPLHSLARLHFGHLCWLENSSSTSRVLQVLWNQSDCNILRGSFVSATDNPGIFSNPGIFFSMPYSPLSVLVFRHNVPHAVSTSAWNAFYPPTLDQNFEYG